MKLFKFILFMLLCFPALATLNGEAPDGSFNPFVNILGILYSYVIFGVIQIQNKLL